MWEYEISLRQIFTLFTCKLNMLHIPVEKLKTLIPGLFPQE